MKFRVRLMDVEGDADTFPVITMPAAPFVGLNIRVLRLGGDFVPIDEIYWDDEKEEYLAYFEP